MTLGDWLWWLLAFFFVFIFFMMLFRVILDVFQSQDLSVGEDRVVAVHPRPPSPGAVHLRDCPRQGHGTPRRRAGAPDAAA